MSQRGVTIGYLQRRILYLLRDKTPRSSAEIDSQLELELSVKRLGMSISRLWRAQLIRPVPGITPTQWKITDAGLWAI